MVVAEGKKSIRHTPHPLHSSYSEAHVIFEINLLFPVAGAEWDAEPPRLPARPPGGHGVRVQPDHSGPGGGHARQPAQLHRHPAAVCHEDLPQPPTGQITDL